MRGPSSSRADCPRLRRRPLPWHRSLVPLVDRRSTLRSAPGDSGSRAAVRGRKLLVVVQVALSVVVLAAAASLGRSLYHLSRVDPGYEADHVFVVPVDVRDPAADQPRNDLFFADLLRRLERIPGVGVGEPESCRSALPASGHRVGDVTRNGGGEPDPLPVVFRDVGPELLRDDRTSTVARGDVPRRRDGLGRGRHQRGPGGPAVAEPRCRRSVRGHRGRGLGPTRHRGGPQRRPSRPVEHGRTLSVPPDVHARRRRRDGAGPRRDCRKRRRRSDTRGHRRRVEPSRRPRREDRGGGHPRALVATTVGRRRLRPPSASWRSCSSPSAFSA